MIIIWGTKVNRHPRGVVADKCPVCMENERFSVTDHYEVSHLYYISLGQGTLIATTRACWQCGTEFHCSAEAYDEFLDDQSAQKMPIDELIERTNTPMARARDARRQLEEMARAPSAPLPPEVASAVAAPGTSMREIAPSAQDAELREALGRLEPYEGLGPQVSELLRELQAWRSLDSSARAELLGAVNAFIESQQRIDRAAAFFGSMAQSFPQHLGCLPAIVLLAFLISVFFWSPITNWHFGISIAYAVVALLAVIAVYYYVTNVIRRRWYRNTILPKIKEEGIDLNTLLAVMVGIAQSPDRIDERVRELAGSAPLLQDEAARLASVPET